MSNYKNIYQAIDNGDLSAIKSFLPKCINIKNRYGLTPLNYACKICNPYVLKEVVKMFLDAGADPNTTNEYGDSPLHTIYYNNSCLYSPDSIVEVASILIDAGANPNLRRPFFRPNPHRIARLQEDTSNVGG